MTVEEFFDELANCFAVTVDDTICYPQYYNPEDRCGDDTQPLVEMLDGNLCLEPSDVDKIVVTEYIVFVTLHNKSELHFQFLDVKKFEADIYAEASTE